MAPSSNKTALVPLAPGFEEIEAITIIDVLRRAGIATTTASLSRTLQVAGSHEIPIIADALFETAAAGPLPDAVVLPGGMPGSRHLADHPPLRELLRKTAAAGGLVAAVCAAPIALHAAGLLAGRRVTAYPTVRADLAGAVYTGNRVETDGNIITGLGPGAAAEFALKIVERLAAPETALELAERMVVRDCREK